MTRASTCKLRVIAGWAEPSQAIITLLMGQAGVGQIMHNGIFANDKIYLCIICIFCYYVYYGYTFLLLLLILLSIILYLKVLTHQAIGKVTRISDAKIQIFHQRILFVHVKRNANMRVKFAKRRKFGALSVAP